VRDRIRYIVSVGFGLLSLILTTIITTDVYFSIGIGLVIYNLLIFSLRPEIVNSFFNEVSPNGEFLLFITFSVSLGLFVHVPGQNFKLGVIHSLMVLLAYHVGLSTGILSNNNKND